MFHTHLFSPLPKDPEKLYCTCGASRDIHRHIWEVASSIVMRHNITGKERTTGSVLVCSKCGEHKEFQMGRD